MKLKSLQGFAAVRRKIALLAVKFTVVNFLIMFAALAGAVWLNAHSHTCQTAQSSLETSMIAAQL
jgi:hypothetical protein